MEPWGHEVHQHLVGVGVARLVRKVRVDLAAILVNLEKREFGEFLEETLSMLPRVPQVQRASQVE